MRLLILLKKVIEELFNKFSMKRISIFGSTGSVGTQTLSVINQNKNKLLQNLGTKLIMMNLLIKMKRLVTREQKRE